MLSRYIYMYQNHHTPRAASERFINSIFMKLSVKDYEIPQQGCQLQLSNYLALIYEGAFLLAVDPSLDWRYPLVWYAHDDVIKYKHIPYWWPFVRAIHWSPGNIIHNRSLCQLKNYQLLMSIRYFSHDFEDSFCHGGLGFYRVHHDFYPKHNFKTH